MGACRSERSRRCSLGSGCLRQVPRRLSSPARRPTSSGSWGDSGRYGRRTSVCRWRASTDRRSTASLGPSSTCFDPASNRGSRRPPRTRSRHWRRPGRQPSYCCPWPTRSSSASTGENSSGSCCRRRSGRRSSKPRAWCPGRSRSRFCSAICGTSPPTRTGRGIERRSRSSTIWRRRWSRTSARTVVSSRRSAMATCWPIRSRRPRSGPRWRSQQSSHFASATLPGMTIYRMDHAGVVVEDLAAAIAFFVELGLELEGEATVEGVSESAGPR